jgi:hypothetical protein
VPRLLTATLLVLLSAPLAAQWAPYPTPRVPRAADGRPDLRAPAPRTADGRPDFTGIWANPGWREMAADLSRPLRDVTRKQQSLRHEQHGEHCEADRQPLGYGLRADRALEPADPDLVGAEPVQAGQRQQAEAYSGILAHVTPPAAAGSLLGDAVLRH